MDGKRKRERNSRESLPATWVFSLGSGGRVVFLQAFLHPIHPSFHPSFRKSMTSWTESNHGCLDRPVSRFRPILAPDSKKKNPPVGSLVLNFTLSPFFHSLPSLPVLPFILVTSHPVFPSPHGITANAGMKKCEEFAGGLCHISRWGTLPSPTSFILSTSHQGSSHPTCPIILKLSHRTSIHPNLSHPFLPSASSPVIPVSSPGWVSLDLLLFLDLRRSNSWSCPPFFFSWGGPLF